MLPDFTRMNMSPHAEAIGNSYEIPLDHQLLVFKEAGLLQDDTPKLRFSKEDLLHFHSNNIRLQKVGSKEASYLVLPAAYAPSIASLNNLQKVIQDSVTGNPKLTNYRYLLMI